jgi:hypothetical protein
MHRPVRTAVLLVALVAAGARRGAAQTVRFGVLGDTVTAMLRAAWTEDSTQNERAYYVERARISTHPVLGGGVDSIFRILSVRPAVTQGQDPNHVQFECAPHTPELHTHAPATCLTDDAGSCHPDGPGAYSCQPSREDYEKLVSRGDQFGIIQCDRRAFRFYYPSEYLPRPQPVHVGTSSP